MPFHSLLDFVRLVVPTSLMMAPLFSIMSGILKDPPISTNCPLDTITSPLSASELIDKTTAAALLLTTNDDSLDRLSLYAL